MGNACIVVLPKPPSFHRSDAPPPHCSRTSPGVLGAQRSEAAPASRSQCSQNGGRHPQGHGSQCWFSRQAVRRAAATIYPQLSSHQVGSCSTLLDTNPSTRIPASGLPTRNSELSHRASVHTWQERAPRDCREELERAHINLRL